jgi:AraC family transcriptional regulator
MLVESLFTELSTRLLFVSREDPQQIPKKQSLPKHLLRRVFERMHAGLDSDLSLSDLAAESGYSRSQFIRMFKAAVGDSPHSHLRELRLRRAQQLITERLMQIVDIAFACGFCSHAHFSTAFTRRFGLAPSLYRQMVLNEKRHSARLP